MEFTEKVKIYDSGFAMVIEENISKVRIDSRIGGIYIPKLLTTEALAMATDFVQAILYGKEPVSNWKPGLMVIKILEGASKSIKARGKEITYLP